MSQSESLKSWFIKQRIEHLWSDSAAESEQILLLLAAEKQWDEVKEICKNELKLPSIKVAYLVGYLINKTKNTTKPSQSVSSKDSKPTEHQPPTEANPTKNQPENEKSDSDDLEKMIFGDDASETSNESSSSTTDSEDSDDGDSDDSDDSFNQRFLNGTMMMQKVIPKSDGTDKKRKLNQMADDTELNSLFSPEQKKRKLTEDPIKGIQHSQSAEPETTRTISSGKMSGTIKHWSYPKCFGYIAYNKNNESSKVFVEQKHCTLTPPHEAPTLGSKVEFVIVKDYNDGRDHAEQVTAIGGGPCQGGRQRGFVQLFDKEKGFGVISANDGSGEVPFERRNLWKCGRTLIAGDCVEFDMHTKQSGECYATYVRLTTKKPDETFVPLARSKIEAVLTQNQKKVSTNLRKATDVPNITGPRNTGTVDRFFHEKGYGFIRMDNGTDIFVHGNDCYLQRPHLNPKVGSKVEFTVEQSGGGKPKAGKVTAVGGGKPCEGGRSQGTIKFYDNRKGTGYIFAEDGSELQFSVTNLWEVLDPLNKGDKVLYDQRSGENGFFATYVTLISTDFKQCYICGELGHLRSQCPKNTKSKNSGHQNVQKKENDKIIGTLSRWKHDRNYGYIEYEDKKGGYKKGIMVFPGDIYLEEKYTCPKVGSQVAFTIESDRKGGHAANVTSVDGGYCAGGRFTGTVKVWMTAKNRGWIQADDGTGDIAVLAKDLCDDLRSLNRGDKVEYDPRQGNSEYFAVYVKKISQ